MICVVGDGGGVGWVASRVRRARNKQAKEDRVHAGQERLIVSGVKRAE